MGLRLSSMAGPQARLIPGMRRAYGPHTTFTTEEFALAAGPHNLLDLHEPPNDADAARLRSTRTLVVLWLIVLALGIALIPLVVVSGWVRSDSARLRNELAQVELALADAEIPSDEVVRLTEAVAANEATLAALESVVVPVGLDWPRVAAALADYDPVLLRLTAIAQRDDRLRIAGRAINNDAVIRYEQRLFDSGVFSAVVILSQVAAPPARSPANNAQAETTPPFGTVDFEIELVVRPPRAPGEQLQ